MKSTAALFSRLLVIARSERHLDLQTMISEFEFNSINPMLMTPDSTLLPCKNKSGLIHALEKLTEGNAIQQPAPTSDNLNRFLIIDGMAVVQALMHAIKFKTCRDLGQAMAKTTDARLEKYSGGRVIFDNYNKQISIKDEIRYSSTHQEDLIIEDDTPIKDTQKFLSSKKTKDGLTLFLADKLIKLCKKPVVTATRKEVLTNSTEQQASTGVSSNEEADTLMMVHRRVPGRRA